MKPRKQEINLYSDTYKNAYKKSCVNKEIKITNYVEISNRPLNIKTCEMWPKQQSEENLWT